MPHPRSPGSLVFWTFSVGLRGSHQRLRSWVSAGATKLYQEPLAEKYEQCLRDPLYVSQPAQLIITHKLTYFL